MSAKGVFQVFPIDLSDPLDREPVSVSGRPRLVVARGDSDAELRIDSPGVEPLPGDTGQELCADGGIDTVYVTHPGGGGTLYLVAVKSGSTYSADRGGEGGGAAAIPPLRLGGNLAAGTTVAHGETVEETVELNKVDAIRMAGLVDGQLTAETVHVAARQSVLDMDGYENTNGDPRIVTVDGGGQTLRVFDASNPLDLEEIGSVTGTAGTSWAEVRVDPVQEVAVVLADDTSASSVLMAVVDLSTETAPAEQGNVVIESGSSYGRAPGGGLDVDPTREVAVTVMGSAATGNVYLVDYSSPSSPSLSDTLSQTITNGGGVDTSQGMYFTAENSFTTGAADVHAIDYTGGTLAVINTETIAGIGESDMHSVIDKDRGLILVNGDSGLLGVVDVRDPSSMFLRATLQLTQNQQGDMAYEPEDSILYVRNLDGGNIEAISTVDLVDPNNPRILVDAIRTNGSGSVLEIGTTTIPGVGGYWVEDSDDVLATLDQDLGGVELSLLYHREDGTVRAAGNPSTLDLEDGREAVLESDTIGEDGATVRLLNRSGQQVTVQHIDLFREVLA